MGAHRYSAEMVEKLRAMASTGHPASSIAVELNKVSALPVTAESVRKKCVAVGIRLRRPAERYCHQVAFPVLGELWPVLRRRAGKRGLSVPQLCRLIVEIVVDEGMVGAVIDERPRRPPPKPAAAVVRLRPYFLSPGEVDDVRALAARGLGNREIGRAIGRNHQTIARVLAKHGNALRDGRPDLPANKEETTWVQQNTATAAST